MAVCIVLPLSKQEIRKLGYFRLWICARNGWQTRCWQTVREKVVKKVRFYRNLNFEMFIMISCSVIQKTILSTDCNSQIVMISLKSRGRTVYNLSRARHAQFLSYDWKLSIFNTFTYHKCNCVCPVDSGVMDLRRTKR